MWQSIIPIAVREKVGTTEEWTLVTFALPPFGYAKVRKRYRPDVIGKTVYHCYIPPHEDNGMMAAFELVN